MTRYSEHPQSGHRQLRFRSTRPDLRPSQMERPRPGERGELAKAHQQMSTGGFQSSLGLEADR